MRSGKDAQLLHGTERTLSTIGAAIPALAGCFAPIHGQLATLTVMVNTAIAGLVSPSGSVLYSDPYQLW